MAMVQRVWKALTAGVASGLAAWGVAAQTGPVQGGTLIAFVLAAVGVALATYLAPPNAAT